MDFLIVKAFRPAIETDVLRLNKHLNRLTAHAARLGLVQQKRGTFNSRFASNSPDAFGLNLRNKYCWIVWPNNAVANRHNHVGKEYLYGIVKPEMVRNF